MTNDINAFERGAMLEACSCQSPGNVTWQGKISAYSPAVHHMAVMRPHGR